MKDKLTALVDPGFDQDFSSKELDNICGLFGSAEELQSVVYDIHSQHNVLDMKRGEFYPEILRANLSMKRALVAAYGLDPDIGPNQCHPNFGTNGSIDTILTAMKILEFNRKIDPTQEGGMLVATPTYFRNYNSAGARQIRMAKVSLSRPDWKLRLDTFLEQMRIQSPTVIFLVTPNNPTGIAIPDADIIQIIEAASSETLVVMDRTLVNIRNEISTRELLRRFPDKRLAILHSFSKYWGLSHLRIGFAIYSNVALANEIAPYLPLGMGLEGTLKATKILVEGGPLSPSENIVNNVRESKAILDEFCNRSRYDCTDFVANYCLLLLPNSSSREITEALDKNGIKIMGGHQFTGDCQEDVIRLHTGGKPEFMQRTVETLERLFP